MTLPTLPVCRNLAVRADASFNLFKRVGPGKQQLLGPFTCTAMGTARSVWPKVQETAAQDYGINKADAAGYVLWIPEEHTWIDEIQAADMSVQDVSSA